MKKLNPSLIGLFQALGVIIYCALVVGLFELLRDAFFNLPVFFSSAISLIVLVFSAAVTGSIVFGRVAYLSLNGKLKEGLSILAYTLLYCLGIVLIIVILVTALA
jgi:hypothetical protein